MDRGLWISWYNLPRECRDAYLAWLHGTYIPKMLERPDVLWAAHYASEEKVALSGAKGRLSQTRDSVVPAGDRFILLFGAGNAHVFVDPTPGEMHAQLPDNDRKMLAMRQAERSNIMTEESKVYGPEAGRTHADLALAPCIQIGSFNSDTYENEDELAAWYARWRLPSMQKLPGCVRVRKLVSVSGWAKHAIIYEFVSVQARNDQFLDHERTNPDMEAWTDRVVRKLVHAPGSPNLARRIWPPVSA
jgi:hypothetical protein